ncbi:MAG: DUF1016 N-terminal domain-containing protein, partial [Clostridia bacterium]|nr:DUF1016 N-terminal domain-containing protein [Clostridia bacterium]
MNELDNTFAEIAQIIEEARDNAYRKVNEELILMYQRVGQFLSEKSKEANYGDGYIGSSLFPRGWIFCTGNGQEFNQGKKVIIIPITVTNSFSNFDFIVESF